MPRLMRTSNPVLNEKRFEGYAGQLGERMTLQGTVNKTGLLLVCAIASAAWTWHLFDAGPLPACGHALSFDRHHRRILSARW